MKVKRIKFRHMKFKRLLELSQMWSIDEALWILIVYGCQRDEILWSNFWTTPYEMAIVTDPEYPATKIRVRFLGGPSNGHGYAGPFSMFVIDRILWYKKRHEISWEWLLRFNGDTTTHIKDQLKYTKPLITKQQYLPGFGDETAGTRQRPTNVCVDV